MNTDVVIDHLSAMLDIDKVVIQACKFDKGELAELFDRVAQEFNAIAEAHDKLSKLPTSYEIYLPGGQYASSRDETFHEHAVEAVRLGAKITSYEQSLSRTAGSLSTRALIRSQKLA